MTELRCSWVRLTEEERNKVLTALEVNPTLVAEFVDAAQSGDVMAAEALLAFNRTIIIEDWDHPEETRIYSDSDE